jgi:hypothetical protein
MLTGMRPFQRDSAAATLASVPHGQPRPIEALRHDVPPELRKPVAKRLEKDEERRYPSGVELHQELAALGEEFDCRFLSVRGLVRNRKFLAGAVALHVLLIALAVWTELRARRSAWVRNVALPQAARMVGAGRMDEAFFLLRFADPGDRGLLLFGVNYLGDHREAEFLLRATGDVEVAIFAAGTDRVDGLLGMIDDELRAEAGAVLVDLDELERTWTLAISRTWR